ncbi:alpha/beta fold hydrolase [Pontibacter arcticus]|uniref:Alpha/beta hydrolase n=1 Tax=Pontibacter arcticus TaxID=2080288 RepID=A0A364REM6_9BACT|nr:alpha/beta hydrolase [Pontibacter arcticus]RAU82790.1 alpha/beta hydrolase [Pontibacter arcticus]
MLKLAFEFFEVNEVTLHVARAGDKSGETIVLLHGFPEFWYGWRKQLTFFADHGYQVVAPDQRGYNLSSKPQETEAYTLEKLTADIVALIRQLNSGKVVLIGHDWGGVVAWAIAIHFPDLLHKLVILNMPHPAIMQQHLRSNPRQMFRSWYAAFFQIPVLPEQAAQAFDFKLLEQSMAGTANAGTFSEEDLATYREAWEQPGALTSMINWYRAFKYTKLELDKDITVPTLMLWGKKDAFLGAEMALPSINRCTNGKLLFLDQATHWLHHEEPEKVNQEIIAFLKST